MLNYKRLLEICKPFLKCMQQLQFPPAVGSIGLLCYTWGEGAVNFELSEMCMLVTIRFTNSPRWLCDCLLKASEYKGGGLHVFSNLWGFGESSSPGMLHLQR